MKHEVHFPTALLKPFIKAYHIIESEKELVNRVLPTTSVTMSFRYRGLISYSENNCKIPLTKTLISGVRKSVRLINYASDTANLVVIFKETGAHSFIREPIHHLFETSISLDHFMDAQMLCCIEEQLAERSNNHQRIEVIEKFLLSKLYPHKSDALIVNALQKIHAAKGAIKIKELANSLCLSHDAFEKRFRKTAGTTPKQFACLVRMNLIVNNRHTSQSLSALAFDAGYYDQAHFNKDFKVFTGQTPSTFFESPPPW